VSSSSVSTFSQVLACCSVTGSVAGGMVNCSGIAILGKKERPHGEG